MQHLQIEFENTMNLLRKVTEPIYKMEKSLEAFKNLNTAIIASSTKQLAAITKVLSV
jgi:hypothetical protein